MDWLLCLAALLTQDLPSLSSWEHSLSFFWGRSSHLLGFMSLLWFTLLFVGSTSSSRFWGTMPWKWPREEVLVPLHHQTLKSTAVTSATLPPLGNVHCYRRPQDGQSLCSHPCLPAQKLYLALCFKVNIQSFSLNASLQTMFLNVKKMIMLRKCLHSFYTGWNNLCLVRWCPNEFILIMLVGNTNLLWQI